MFGFLKKTTPEERRSVNLFSCIVDQVPEVNRYSYRNNGKFEIIFDNTIGTLVMLENQARFNLLFHAWIIIWGKDNAELHIGATNLLGARVEINASKLYIGHKFYDHDEKLKGLLSLVGLSV